MNIKDIQEMINKVDIDSKILIVRKDFYDKHQEEINNLIKDNWKVDLTITNTLDKKTDAIIMDKKKFYGIDY